MSYLEKVNAYINLTRPYNATPTLLAFSVGYIFANSQPITFDFFVGLAILLLVHSMVTVQNDVEDLEIDRSNHAHTALLNQSVSVKNAKAFALGMGGTVICLAIISSSRVIHVVFATALIILSWLYNYKPFRLSQRPIASIFLLGLCYGALPFLYGYLLGGGYIKVSVALLLITSGLFLQRISLSIMKDYKDASGDKLHHKHTFYLTYGKKLTALISSLTVIMAYMLLIVFICTVIDFSIGTLLMLLIIFSLAARNIIWRLSQLKTNSEKGLNTIFKRNLIGQNQFDAALLLCLILF